MSKGKREYTLEEVEKCQINAGIVYELFHRKISKHVSRQLAKTDLTPNQITLLSFILLIIASIFFLFADFVYLLIGALILNFSYILDCVDGEVARLKKMTSKKGGFIDELTDRIGEVLVYTSLSVGLYRKFNEPMFLLIGLLVMATLFMIYHRWDKAYEGSGAKLTSDLVKTKIQKIMPKLSAKSISFGMEAHFFLILLGAVLFPLIGGVFNTMTIALLLIIVIGTVYWVAMMLSALKYLRSEK